MLHTQCQGCDQHDTMGYGDYAQTDYDRFQIEGTYEACIIKLMGRSNVINVNLIVEWNETYHNSTGNPDLQFYKAMTANGGINVRTQFCEYSDARRIGIDLSWRFNATRSRYKGSHAGQNERNRL